MGRRLRSRRRTALAGGLSIIFGLAGGACAARQAPAAPPTKSQSASPAEPLTAETADAGLAAALGRLKNGNSAENLERVANGYLRLGVFDKAVSYLGKAIDLAPRNAQLYEARARVFRDWGIPDSGLGDAHRAVFLAPRSAEALNTLGTIQFALGQKADAVGSFERALKLAPQASWALNNLCYVALLGGDESAALARCGSAIEQEPALTAARNNLALVHAAAGRLDQAREVFLASGDRSSALYNIGIVLLARRDYSAAADSFSEACRETPRFDAACRRAIEARTLGARSQVR